MTCQKCRGTAIVRDYDPMDLYFVTYKCVNCGCRSPIEDVTKTPLKQRKGGCSFTTDGVRCGLSRDPKSGAYCTTHHKMQQAKRAAYAKKRSAQQRQARKQAKAG